MEGQRPDGYQRAGVGLWARQRHGRDHRLATQRPKDGRTEWIPPPALDTGQARVNDYHYPERMLQDPDDDDDEPQP
jgi:hypothetical protein